jgi:hypothetical protein
VGLLSDNDLINAILALGAEAVTVDGATVTAIVGREPGDAFGVEGYVLTAKCRASDVSTVEHGAAIVVPGRRGGAPVSCTVEGIERRDDGLAVLRLQEVNDAEA